MSGRMEIRFGSDMPPATVEVVAPDLQTVGRIMLAPGQTRGIDVPSEGSFLRVHLASGEVVTLRDPGNLNRTIDLSSLQQQLRRRPPLSASLPEALPGGMEPEAVVLDSARSKRATGLPKADAGATPTLDGGFTVNLDSQSAKETIAGREMLFTPWQSESAYDLMLSSPNVSLSVRIPGHTEQLFVRSDLARDGRRVISVRVKTTDATADTIGSYLVRGDLHSASAMAEWAPEAKALLRGKIRNPFGATVGAYLLLRLRRFDLMHDWPRNLADLFPDLADGSVIHAWQLIYQKEQDREDEVREYLNRAAAAPLPVFTEGTRLLRDGIRLLGEPAKEESLGTEGGVVLWGSPFTAVLRGSASDPSARLDFDIDYATRV